MTEHALAFTEDLNKLNRPTRVRCFMNSVERVLTTINLKEPDRVPLDLGGPISGITKIAYDGLKTHLEMRELPSVVWDRMQQLVEIDERVLQRFGIDFRHIRLNPPRKEEIKEVSGESFVNEWGITFRRSGYYFEIVDDLSPLYKASLIDEVESYRGPKPHEGRFRGLREKAKKLSEQGFAVTCDAFTGGVLELPVWLRGFKKFYHDLVANPEFADALLDRASELLKLFWGAFLDEVGDYAHIALIGDDYGMQQGMLISPKMWREKVKNRIRELFSFVKQKAKVKIELHSCGSVRPIVGDLIEIGLDVLNPVQPRAKDMDSFQLKEEFGDRICFHGGIDIQYVLPTGSRKDVQDEVKTKIQAFAPGGGYILGAAHNLQPDVPPSNIAAMYDAAHRYGRYPIDQMAGE